MSLMYPTTRFRAAAAFTLLEMTMSLTIMALVFTTVGSVFVLAAKVMPTPDSAEAASVHQSAALSQLLEDLQVARYITEDTANAVTLVVDDRTGDGLPDRLRYAWSGTIGDPLTLSINGSATGDGRGGCPELCAGLDDRAAGCNRFRCDDDQRRGAADGAQHGDYGNHAHPR